MVLRLFKVPLRFRPCPFTPWSADRLAEPVRRRWRRAPVLDRSLPRSLARDGWWLET